jgi:hypothetical protein
MKSTVTRGHQIESPIGQFITLPDGSGDTDWVKSIESVAREGSALPDGNNPKFALILVFDGE